MGTRNTIRSAESPKVSSLLKKLDKIITPGKPGGYDFFAKSYYTIFSFSLTTFLLPISPVFAYSISDFEGVMA